MLKKSLLEENFFYMYHMRIPPHFTERIPIFERKYYINLFTEQKKKENEAIEAANRRAKSRSKSK